MKQSVSGLRSNNSCLLPSANDHACQNLSKSFQSSVSTKKIHEKSDQIWSFTWHQEEHWLSGMNVNYYSSLTRFPHHQSHSIFPSYCEGWAAPSAIPSRLFLKSSNFWDTSEKQHEFNYTGTFRVDKNSSSFTPLRGNQQSGVTQLSKVEVLHLKTYSAMKLNQQSKAKLMGSKKIRQTLRKTMKKKINPKTRKSQMQGVVNTFWEKNCKHQLIWK